MHLTFNWHQIAPLDQTAFVASLRGDATSETKGA
jgi:hypothetical protein